MNLFVPFRRAKIDSEAAFEQAFREGALDRVPGRCVHCGRRILNPSNMARHIRAKHPAPQSAVPEPVVAGASTAVSAPDTLDDSLAA
jgi:hypothetical protein